MNLSQAQQELAGRGFDYLNASRMTIMLNDAKNEFEDYWSWPWLEQVVTGPAPLAVPRLKAVYYVHNGTDELLGADARDLIPLTQTGTPAVWWLDGPVGDGPVTINVWPSGPAALEARIAQESPELAAPTDTPLIPARYHDIWLDLAVCGAYVDSDNFTGAQALKATVNARIQDLILRYETRNRQNPRTISIRVGSLDD